MTKTEEKIVNFDLDFRSLFKEFPQDKKNTYIYIRGHRTGKDNSSCYSEAIGDQELMAVSVIGAMEREELAFPFVNAVLNFLNQDGNGSIRKEFVKKLRK